VAGSFASRQPPDPRFFVVDASPDGIVGFFHLAMRDMIGQFQEL
jgi:hypothetical protein